MVVFESWVHHLIRRNMSIQTLATSETFSIGKPEIAHVYESTWPFFHYKITCLINCSNLTQYIFLKTPWLLFFAKYKMWELKLLVLHTCICSLVDKIRIIIWLRLRLHLKNTNTCIMHSIPNIISIHMLEHVHLETHFAKSV